LFRKPDNFIIEGGAHPAAEVLSTSCESVAPLVSTAGTDDVGSPDSSTPFSLADCPPRVQSGHPSVTMDQYEHGEKLQSAHGEPGPSTVLTVDHPKHREQPQMIHGGSAGLRPTSVSDRSFVPDVRMDQNEQRGVPAPVGGISASDPPPAYHLGWDEHHSSSSSAQPTAEFMHK
jgi:hypothetical protein